MKLDYELIFGMDKQMHLVSYAVISLLLAIAIILISDDQYVKRRLSFIWIALVTIGIAEEYRHYMMPDRDAELLDALANMVGVTIGLWVPWFILYVSMYRGHFLFKLFAFYSLILVPLLIGLVYVNEKPFVSFEEPFRERWRSLVALVGL